MRDTIRAILEGDAQRVLDTFVERSWPQQEAVAITLQAWRRDKTLGRTGWYMADGGLLRAIYLGVSIQHEATFGTIKLGTGVLDNASMLLLIAALEADDAELMALVWEWDPQFKIMKVGANGAIPTSHNTNANDFATKAPLCAAWYRKRFAE